MSRANVLNSPRLLELKKKRRQVVLSKFGIILGSILVIVGAGAYFSRLEGLNIQEIKIEGNTVLDGGVLTENVKEEIAGKYAYLFPKTNVLIYPQKNIKNSLLAEFPRLASVELDAKNRKVLTVRVKEREAKYTWCGSALSEDTADIILKRAEEECYFMDELGYIFDTAPYFSGEVYFKFYGPLKETSTLPGTYFARDRFADLVSFKEVLSGMGLKPVMINVKEGGDVEIYLARAGKGLGPKIIFNTDTDPKIAAENLQAALSTDPLLSGFKNKYSLLLYIDLRFGNKVYFKFNE